MTSAPSNLIDGYRRFRAGPYQHEAARYRALADGQSPQTMIIACADSRADPATIFGVAPGELFVVRNVANLVPPYSKTAAAAGSAKPVDLHGTSAAIEYGVCGLGVRDLVVMGHADCGGVNASLATVENSAVGQFVAPWVELLATARDKVLEDPSCPDKATQRRKLERDGILVSLENLKTFPFVSKAVGDGRVALHGAWFSIGTGELYWYNAESKRFDILPC